MAKRSVHKDPDVALITAKTLSVQQCTLYALSGRHLVYVAEEAEPSRGAFFKIATETTAPAAQPIAGLYDCNY